MNSLPPEPPEQDLRAELERLRSENERLRGEAKSVARANVNAAFQLLEMSEQRREESDARRQELERALELLEQALLRKDEFLAKVSHELRTPLSGVIGMTTLLMDTELSRAQSGYALSTLASARALLKIIDDILDLSMIEASVLQLEQVDFDLWRVVEEVARVQAQGLGEREVLLGIEIDPAVPQRVVGDPERLRQVLANVCGNAVKFTESGEVIIGVEAVETEGAGARLRFSITDTGCGIPPAALREIFESFRQADDSPSRRHGGTGLGLTIAAGLVKLMGGTLAAQSEEGCGSRFFFELHLPPSAVQPTPIDLSGMRVMVATRCAHHRRAAELHLSHAGAEVEFIDNLKVLLELFRNPSLSPPDLLVLEASFFEGSQCRGVVERCLGLGPDTVRVALLAPCAASGSSMQLPGVSHLFTPLSPSDLLECAYGETPASKAFDSLTVARRALEEATGGVRIQILLVEDNPINQRVGQRTLERLGCSVKIAANGNAAIEMTERGEFDLVLMDCQMPEMDGYQATAAIRERDAREERHTPVVALTAHARPEDRQRCLDAGMDDHLSKPTDALRLAEIVARYAMQKGRRRAG